MLSKVKKALKKGTPAMEVHQFETEDPIRPIWKKGNSFSQEHIEHFENEDVGNVFLRYTNGSSVNYIDIYENSRGDFIIIGQHGSVKIKDKIRNLEIPEDNLDQEKINEIIDVFYRF